MPRCLLLVNGSNYDVTNLMNEEGLRNYVVELRRQATRRQQQQQQQQHQPPTSRRGSNTNFDWSVPLYPNLRDPCNKRLLRDVLMDEWKSVPLVKDPTTQSTQADKYAEFYELQRIDMERMQAQHQHLQDQEDLSHAGEMMTSLPQRAQTAPLHSHNHNSSTAASLPVLSHQTTTFASTRSSGSMTRNTSISPPRQSLVPAFRRPHRHSTTAVPGDIDSSSSGLRPRVNYKSLYTRRQNLSGNSLTGLLTSNYEEIEEDDTTSTTMMSSSHFGQDQGELDLLGDDINPAVLESPVEEEEEDCAVSPTTMEIAPNVRVAVRSSQETYKAVQSGDYTVATCFACCATIVCVDDAAYVLCPDCQVVSPLGFNGGSPHDASKKDDPYGIGTGLKREWVNEWVGSI